MDYKVLGLGETGSLSTPGTWVLRDPTHTVACWRAFLQRADGAGLSVRDVLRMEGWRARGNE